MAQKRQFKRKMHQNSAHRDNTPSKGDVVALKIHGYSDDISLGSSSDSGQSEFNEEYYRNKPGPINISERQVVVIGNDKQYITDFTRRYHELKAKNILDKTNTVNDTQNLNKTIAQGVILRCSTNQAENRTNNIFPQPIHQPIPQIKSPREHHTKTNSISQTSNKNQTVPIHEHIRYVPTVPRSQPNVVAERPTVRLNQPIPNNQLSSSSYDYPVLQTLRNQNVPVQERYQNPQLVLPPDFLTIIAQPRFAQSVPAANNSWSSTSNSTRVTPNQIERVHWNEPRSSRSNQSDVELLSTENHKICCCC